MPENAWDDVEHAILSAARQPATCGEIADRADVTLDVAKTQIEALHKAGILVQAVDGGVRYRLTFAGHKRMFALADANRSDRTAAA